MKHFTFFAVFCAEVAALSAHGQVLAQAGATQVLTGPQVGLAFGAAFGKARGNTVTVGSRFMV